MKINEHIAGLGGIKTSGRGSDGGDVNITQDNRQVTINIETADDLEKAKQILDLKNSMTNPIKVIDVNENA